ncbi:hypothetical protein ACJJTC_006915 [Scirpophaga incertulas]
MANERVLETESSLKDTQILQGLIVKRSSIKGRITKFKNYLINIKTKDSLLPIDLTELNLKLGKFMTLSNEFDDLQSQIEILNSNMLSEEIDERDNIEQSFITNIALAQNIIQKLQPNTRFDECNQNLNSINLSAAPTLIEISNPTTNNKETVRALLDCGSQSSFVSKSLQTKLSLPSTSLHNNIVNIIGIGNNISNMLV